jgi:DNA-binding transcriptional ArsR family regulator
VLNLTPIRLEILRDLALHPEGSTTVEVAARIEADYRTVWSHLKLLRAKKVVTDEQASHRIGPLYRINLQALRAHFEAALAYASGANAGD